MPWYMSFFFFFLIWFLEATQNEPYHTSFLMKHNYGFKNRTSQLNKELDHKLVRKKPKTKPNFGSSTVPIFKSMYMTHAILRIFFYMVSIKTLILARVKAFHSRFYKFFLSFWYLIYFKPDHWDPHLSLKRINISLYCCKKKFNWIVVFSGQSLIKPDFWFWNSWVCPNLINLIQVEVFNELHDPSSYLGWS